VSALVVGVGQPDRGDDAVGPLLAARLRDPPRPGVDVRTLPSPVRLAEVWEGYDIVVVVDAVRSGRPAGEITVVNVTDELLPARPGAGGTHGFGLAESVELARAMGRLPRRLVLVGIEATGFAIGIPVSATVLAALPDAERAVVDALGS
jgi:hydrogenase maturation protease